MFEVLHMYKTFGETIASLRRAHGMRQQALAEAMAEHGRGRDAGVESGSFKVGK
ncbi:MAG: hypothetical protein ACLUNO_03860 [Oscillospiraceae bacterium]